MPLVHSFPPIAAPDARLLILGSMPGEASLRAQQYYAHPRNLFWRLLGDVLGEPLSDLPYPQRIETLRERGIAVWDVLHSCERTGSLDSAIAPASIRANDFGAFFGDHIAISRVLFNGGFAETAFRRHVHPHLGTLPLHCQRLPSSSPAHAALDYAAKLARWRAALT